MCDPTAHEIDSLILEACNLDRGFYDKQYNFWDKEGNLNFSLRNEASGF